VEQFGLELFGEFAAVGNVILPFQDAPQPRDLLLVLCVLAAAFLVAPVRGDAELGMIVHVEGADLDFQRAVFGADDGGMQRTVVVALGLRDVVVELARNRLPQVVHQAEDRVAVDLMPDQHAHRANVVQLLETQPLPPHLVDDAGDMLGAAADFGLDAVQCDFRLQALDDALDVGLAVGALFVELRGDGLVGVGFQIAERPVLHFPLDLPHAEPVRQWSEQFARLLAECRAGGGILVGVLLLIWALHSSATQGVGALRQLHQHHANVFHHRQHHLAQRFQLGMRVDALVGALVASVSMRAIAATPRASRAARPKLAANSGLSSIQFCSRAAATASAPTRSSATISAAPTLCAKAWLGPSCRCACSSARQGRSFPPPATHAPAPAWRIRGRWLQSSGASRVRSWLRKFSLPIAAMRGPIF